MSNRDEWVERFWRWFGRFTDVVTVLVAAYWVNDLRIAKWKLAEIDIRAAGATLGAAIVIAVASRFLPHRRVIGGRPNITPRYLVDRDRYAMLDKIRTIWITGLLQHSLYKEILIALNMAEQPDAITLPLDLVVQRPNLAPQPLPPNTHISAIYNDLGKSLIILGEPGAGKTTLLLELAESLLDRAIRDRQHPIPVVFPLASWTEKPRLFADWLVNQIVVS